MMGKLLGQQEVKHVTTEPTWVKNSTPGCRVSSEGKIRGICCQTKSGCQHWATHTNTKKYICKVWVLAGSWWSERWVGGVLGVTWSKFWNVRWSAGRTKGELEKDGVAYFEWAAQRVGCFSAELGLEVGPALPPFFRPRPYWLQPGCWGWYDCRLCMGRAALDCISADTQRRGGWEWCDGEIGAEILGVCLVFHRANTCAPIYQINEMKSRR